MLNVICVLFVSDVLNVSHVSFVPHVLNLMCKFFMSCRPRRKLFWTYAGVNDTWNDGPNIKGLKHFQKSHSYFLFWLHQNDGQNINKIYKCNRDGIYIYIHHILTTLMVTHPCWMHLVSKSASLCPMSWLLLLATAFFVTGDWQDTICPQPWSSSSWIVPSWPANTVGGDFFFLHFCVL